MGKILTRDYMKSLLKRKKDSRDDRDYSLSIVSAVALPQSSSVFKFLTHVEDQTVIGSCTAQTGTTTVEAIRKHHKLSEIDVSALFLYWCERLILGLTDEDSGAEMRTICDALLKYGFCLDAMWPYKESKLFVKPPKACFDYAINYRIKRYERLETLDDIKKCIAIARVPVMLGFPVYTSFFDIGSNGIMPMPKKGEYIEGGHAVTVYGYDLKTQMLLIRNSWGGGWGYQGNFFMPIAFYQKYIAEIDTWRITTGMGI